MMKKEKESPKISVVLTTYNRANRLLIRAVSSVLSQTIKDWELIIIDDCSTDDTQKVCQKLAQKDKRIKYIRHEHNYGSDTKGKNTGLLAAKGEYVAYLDDDCEFLPYHLEKLAERLDKSDKIDFVYCDMWIYNDDKPEWEGQQAITLNHDSQFLLNRNYIDTSEVMHRKELAFKVGGFDERLERFIDWNMWVRMMKAGAKIQRVPIVATNYYIHTNPLSPQKSKRVQVETWNDEELGMSMFRPTFDPVGCYIWLPYLGTDNHKDEQKPKVAIFSLTYDRLEYTKRMWKSLQKSTRYDFDWHVVDNGSSDGTPKWLEQTLGAGRYIANDKNEGISRASNKVVEAMLKGNYQIIVKIDNDCEFLTFGWLESFVDIWKRNHMIYMSPYPEGLVHNPGGAPRVGYSYLGPYFVEVTQHIGGLCAGIDAKAYKDFRWQDKFLHGNQDREASIAFTKQGYMPCYIPLHRVAHMDGTLKQQKKYPDYFERRKEEKQTQWQKE